MSCASLLLISVISCKIDYLHIYILSLRKIFNYLAKFGVLIKKKLSQNISVEKNFIFPFLHRLLGAY
ncbi:hypothetical protein BpHYR1_005481 [Brachionus plicatilis]|uniref:Uncharacterized protein n=1 Tax=Brachionus plicatilis TaxID=10195 RepID=A0A3M7S2T6_BRAPC|nr:hypothetical protein BpHYR1_005481 [Brachionus plicatilis]